MPKKLAPEAVQQHLQTLMEWSISDEGQLTRHVNFETYKAGLVFASAVGFIADKLDHHPDLTIGYKVVTISVSTHSEGGLTELDFQLAGQIDGLLT